MARPCPRPSALHEPDNDCLDRGADIAAVGKGAIADHAFAEQAVSDPTYAAPQFPLSREHLRGELLSDPFVDYFATGWPHLVQD